MKLCTKCGRRPSERRGLGKQDSQAAARGSSSYHPTPLCDDPIHDLADAALEFVQTVALQFENTDAPLGETARAWLQKVSA